MDCLKEINDTQGHKAGDEAIQNCVAAINSQLQQNDLAARLGGDEFAVLLTEVSAQEARLRHQMMAGALADYGVEASVGIGIRSARVSFSQAAASADKKMYESKAQRKGVCDSDLKAA